MEHNSEIEEKVKDIIVTHLDILGEDYDLHASLTDDFGADSLDLVEMGLIAEREFDISIPENYWPQGSQTTPLDLVNIVSILVNLHEPN